MTKEEIIRNLKYTMKKHENDKVDTFGTNISLMCKDILNYLEQEPCDDAVSREAVRQGMMKYGFTAPDITIHEFVADELPPVTPQKYGEMRICPSCGLDVHSDFKCCPRCGAKMQESEDKE